ncbi:hypothetical protein DJ93_3475 [Bacillus clarus]|uniref:Uncharacterized protein n=1 Tax=Bacillus clarus TaxID=2338372 RepID=A0A090YYH4_9BACI|nr:hypothetical protein DJ93_3475 [Bacillus clarus]
MHLSLIEIKSMVINNPFTFIAIPFIYVKNRSISLLFLIEMSLASHKFRSNIQTYTQSIFCKKGNTLRKVALSIWQFYANFIR